MGMCGPGVKGFWKKSFSKVPKLSLVPVNLTGLGIKENLLCTWMEEYTQMHSTEESPQYTCISMSFPGVS
jgi:hypothetical protein